MAQSARRCADCDTSESSSSVSRRKFLQASAAVGAVAATGGIYPVWSRADEAVAATAPETTVAKLYGILSDEQKQQICFAWDHVDPKRGLLRTRVANNWHITEPAINDDFFSDDQRDLIREIYKGLLHPDWHARIDRQLEDDAGGYGNDQNIAIFGQPGGDKFEFVMTGRHMTMRCDGNSTEHVAFGGPIFYGHAPQDEEEPGHPGNVFWEQGAAANRVFDMLDGKQRAIALVSNLPNEQAVAFRGPSGQFPGLAVSEMSADQQGEVEKVIAKLVEPYRNADREEVAACLKSMGGLEKCSLAFYQDGDIGNDQIWDCWRLEGPSFVWYFRGSPHVHVWANVASSPDVKLNA
ncbi:MAG: DUF3500 domain-containing protein [Planctomycetia bacterium]|nr:DUF3500 domain-containing protein [Planctomycetia bacterium]